MIDTHTHCDLRSSEDFEKMYLSGIDTVISCAYYPYKIDNEIVLLNHLKRILEFESKRVESYGINFKASLGIHPVNSIKKANKIYENISNWIKNKDIIAIGEIGLEKCTDLEINVFKKQLEIADEKKAKVIIHTPRKNKEEVIEKIKEIVLETIDSKLVVIDHINKKVIDSVIDEKFTLGLTVQPKKMEVKEAVEILDKYGFDNFLLNSDISSKPSNPLSVPETIRTLKKLGFNEKKISKVAFENAKSFFRI